MGEWIGIACRLPEPGTPIWALFCKKDGVPRKVNPVKDGDYRLTGEGPCFLFMPHRNWYVPASDCQSVGLTHWQPRTGATPPAPPLRVEAPIDGRRRPPRVSPQERERRREWLRACWRDRKPGG